MDSTADFDDIIGVITSGIFNVIRFYSCILISNPYAQFLIQKLRSFEQGY